MSNVVADRACETTTGTGTGNLTLAGAVAGFETLAVAGAANDDTFYYCIEAVDSNGNPTGEWEIGHGTYVSATPAIARTTVLQSSNSDALVSFSAGTKRVFIMSPGITQLWGDISPAQLTSNQNDWAPTGLAKANVVRFSTDASRDITGLTGGRHGRIVTLRNVGSFDGVLKDDSGSSTAANRFDLTADFTVNPGCDGVLQYDGVTSRWRSVLPSTKTINDLTEDASPDINADFLIFYDISAGTTDKVKGISLRNALLGAGSATAGSWPILGNGTILTSAEKGALEHDTNCLYFTTDVGNRGVVPVEHIIRADATRTFTSNTAQQAIFNSPANGRLTLETGVYAFEALIAMTSMSGTSGNGKFSLLGAGSATLAAILWHAMGNDVVAENTGTAAGGSWHVIATQTGADIVTAATGTALCFSIRGTFEVSVAGTIVPSFAQTTAAAAVVSIGSYFMCRRIGSTSMASVGQWD